MICPGWRSVDAWGEHVSCCCWMECSVYVCWVCLISSTAQVQHFCAAFLSGWPIRCWEWGSEAPYNYCVPSISLFTSVTICFTNLLYIYPVYHNFKWVISLNRLWSTLSQSNLGYGQHWPPVLLWSAAYIHTWRRWQISVWSWWRGQQNFSHPSLLWTPGPSPGFPTWPLICQAQQRRSTAPTQSQGPAPCHVPPQSYPQRAGCQCSLMHSADIEHQLCIRPWDKWWDPQSNKIRSLPSGCSLSTPARGGGTFPKCKM